MTTQEIANRYYELARESKWSDIQEKFYDDHAISREPDHVASRGAQVVTQGREALKAKSMANREMIEAIHSHYCSEPTVAGDFFTVAMKRDITFKNRPRMMQEEICLFQVKGSKIVLEQFFY
jgi:hypothetical protein